MQLLTATLTKPARQVKTKFGARTVADVRLADGTETALWRPANDQALASLTTGQAVTVAKDSKGKINLIDNPSRSVAPTSISPQTTGLDKESKQAIAAYIGEMGDLYRYCYETAGEKLATAPNEAKQAMASSLLIFFAITIMSNQTVRHALRALSAADLSSALADEIQSLHYLEVERARHRTIEMGKRLITNQLRALPEFLEIKLNEDELTLLVGELLD